MDIIFVRHKLHALIVINLIAENFISKNFIFVRHHWKDFNEDSEKNNFFFKMIEEKAFYSMHILESRGFIKSFIQVYLLSILAFISCGKFHLTAIRYYPYSITAKLNPLLKIITFDDGDANISKEPNNYFHLKKLDDNSSLKRRLLNFVFPNGSGPFLRKKITLHYTIFKNFENIVPREKLKYIKIDWESYLSDEDVLFLNKIIKSEISLLIGTVFQETSTKRKNTNNHRLKNERKRNFVKNFQKEFLPKLDLIINHPRDCSNISQLKIAKSFHGTAESVIEFLQNQSTVNKINIIHLGTSSAHIVKTFSKVKIYNIFTGCYVHMSHNMWR